MVLGFDIHDFALWVGQERPELLGWKGVLNHKDAVLAEKFAKGMKPWETVAKRAHVIRSLLKEYGKLRYLGGKYRTAGQISTYLNMLRQKGQAYWEPFVGSAWVLARIAGEPNYASDKHPYLIAMWQELQEGWEPPEFVHEKFYDSVKAHPDAYDTHLVGFIGFGCSLGGKWWGGYARDKRAPRPYSTQAQRGLLRKIARIGDRAEFFVADFLTATPPEPGCLIYCDPPYDGTTGYGDIVGEFDTNAFWARVRDLEAQGHTVVVSEYVAPDDFSCVLEIKTQTDLMMADGSKDQRVEKLFRLGNHELMQPRLL